MIRLYEVLIKRPGQPDKRFIRPGDCARHVLEELGVTPTELMGADRLRGVLRDTVYECSPMGRKQAVG